MKNFKYKLAITNYDQDLIDCCVGIGYNTECINGDQNRYIVTGYCDESGLLVNKYSSHDDIDGYRYIIDYKEHPELTKQLLAATDHETEIHKGEYYFGANKSIYKCLCNDAILVENESKVPFSTLLEKANCKLSGKEIVGKKTYIRKGKTEIVFEYFNPSKKVLEGFNLIKGSGINWSKEAYLDRLRTERDRIITRIRKMVNEKSYSSDTYKINYLSWGIKLKSLHENLRNIERNLKSEFKTKDGKDIAHLVETAQELGKSKKFKVTKAGVSFIDSMKSFDKSIRDSQTPSTNPNTSKEITIKCKRKDCNHHSKKKCSLKCPEFVSGGYCGSYDKVVEMDIDNRKYTIRSEGVACWDFKLTFADIRTIMFNYYDKFLSHNMYNIGTESMRINKHIVSISAINALWEKMKELKNAKT